MKRIGLYPSGARLTGGSETGDTELALTIETLVSNVGRMRITGMRQLSAADTSDAAGGRIALVPGAPNRPMNSQQQAWLDRPAPAIRSDGVRWDSEIDCIFHIPHR
jgi:hypothetical protein